jgi:predicted RNA polymerase sigma factor
VTAPGSVEDLLRELAPQVLGVLARRFGDFGAAEDAVQEALLSAALQWPGEGVPDNPRGWLIQTAGHVETAIEHYRAAAARTTSLPERNYLTAKAAALHDQAQR